MDVVAQASKLLVGGGAVSACSAGVEGGGGVAEFGQGMLAPALSGEGSTGEHP